MKELHSDKYLFVLNQLISKNEQKLEKYQNSCSTLPQSIASCDLQKLVPEVKKFKLKMEKLAPQIDKLKIQQKILNVNQNDFNKFEPVQSMIVLKELLYEAIGLWQNMF